MQQPRAYIFTNLKNIYKKEYIFKGSSDVSESESIPPLFEDEFNLYDPLDPSDSDVEASDPSTPDPDPSTPEHFQPYFKRGAFDGITSGKVMLRRRPPRLEAPSRTATRSD